MDTTIIETFSDVILQRDIPDHVLRQELHKYIDTLEFEDEGQETIAFCKSTYWKPDNAIEDVPLFKQYVYNALNDWMTTNGYPRLNEGMPGFPSIETKTWINKAYRYDYQELHMHQNCQVCGIYYLQADGDEGDVCFRRPDYPSFLWTVMPEERRTPSSEYQRHIQPKTGRLLIWRSYLQHLQKRNNTDKERIGVVFNIYFNELQNKS